MNEGDLKVVEGLRALAADGLREAPVSVEERLLGEFRKRQHMRRRNFWLAGGVGAVAAGVAIAMLLGIRPVPVPSAPSAAQVDAQQATQADDEVAGNFYPLPDTDYLPPMDSATVVRVQLPMSSLRLIGWPVSEERAGERIQADVLLGQDGLARGVRFVE
jgi:hypothetical protein